MKAWIQAFRLRTLPLAFSGWLIGFALVYRESEVDPVIAVLTLLTAIFLQILSNLANDYGDATSGVDEHRIGEARMVSSGEISASAMRKAMVVFALLSLISGIGLLMIAFPEDWSSALVFFGLGVIGIIAAIKYTVGKNPYGYAGFGDLFVFIFFGFVLVFGTYFLQTQVFNWLIILPATSMGLFSVGVLNVNNIRDIESDKAAGKYSIPVRLGKQAAIRYHIVLLAAGLVCSLLFVILTYESLLNYLFIPVVILLMKNIKAVRTLPADQLDPFLKQMAISTLIFSLLFSLGQMLSM